MLITIAIVSEAYFSISTVTDTIAYSLVRLAVSKRVNLFFIHARCFVRKGRKRTDVKTGFVKCIPMSV